MKVLARLTALIALSVPLLAFAEVRELEGDHLYRVSTVRAAPGSLSDLLDWAATLRDSGYFKDSGQEPPLLIRHSQGDQWDLMFIMPIESWTAFHSESATQQRSNAASAHARLLGSKDTMIALEEDHFAYGPPLSVVKEAYDENSFFHIEMFTAAPASVSDEEKEAAAIEAGFKGRSDISFYLRSLISSHHDTLAVKVE